MSGHFVAGGTPPPIFAKCERKAWPRRKGVTPPPLRGRLGRPQAGRISKLSGGPRLREAQDVVHGRCCSPVILPIERAKTWHRDRRKTIINGLTCRWRARPSVRAGRYHKTAFTVPGCDGGHVLNVNRQRLAVAKTRAWRFLHAHTCTQRRRHAHVHMRTHARVACLTCAHVPWRSLSCNTSDIALHLSVSLLASMASWPHVDKRTRATLACNLGMPLRSRTDFGDGLRREHTMGRRLKASPSSCRRQPAGCLGRCFPAFATLRASDWPHNKASSAPAAPDTNRLSILGGGSLGTLPLVWGSEDPRPKGAGRPRWAASPKRADRMGRVARVGPRRGENASGLVRAALRAVQRRRRGAVGCEPNAQQCAWPRTSAWPRSGRARRLRALLAAAHGPIRDGMVAALARRLEDAAAKARRHQWGAFEPTTGARGDLERAAEARAEGGARDPRTPRDHAVRHGRPRAGPRPGAKPTAAPLTGQQHGAVRGLLRRPNIGPRHRPDRPTLSLDSA